MRERKSVGVFGCNNVKRKKLVSRAERFLLVAWNQKCGFTLSSRPE